MIDNRTILLKMLKSAISVVLAFIVGIGCGMLAYNEQIFHGVLFTMLSPGPGVPGPGSYYQDRIEMFGRYTERGRIVMLGDSITEQGRWQAMFPCDGIVNQGISGDTTSGALARSERVLATGAEVVFVMLGVNDVTYGHLLINS